VSRRARAETPDDQRLVCRIASLLLCYPDERVHGRLDDVLAALGTLPDRAQREALGRTVGWLRDRPRAETERHHVDAFDLTRRCSPYLTYYRYGDTRQRGMALLALKHTYRRAGVEPAGPELPDYLPVLLEFAALTGEPGVRLLDTHRAGLELLRLALHDTGSPYADVLDAVDRVLPRLSARQAADARRLAAEGPPKEDVGLDPIGTQPFAPPELMGGRVDGAPR
jgi:nitrate reductase delta subunit